MTNLEHPLLMSMVPTKNTKQGIIHYCKNVNIGMSKNMDIRMIVIPCKT